MPDERSTRKKTLEEIDPPRQGPLDEGDVTEPKHEDVPMVPIVPVDR
jgi:hypothetical protein